MSTLFRLTELSGGSIVIDGVNIATVGLHDLRSKLAIIPQDPTLFRGTIRSNLDPFNEHSDLELWNALRQADLVGAEQKLDDTTGRVQLDTQVDDEGLNFSLGQRQLLALARALVRGSQIIVCDEATSSVDFETDQKIQKTIVRGFHGKTLLCIAHRLKTIIGYDRILVMDAGNVAELDTPIKLYDQGGIFRSMCERSGIRRDDFFNSSEANFALESPELEKSESKKLERIFDTDCCRVFPSRRSVRPLTKTRYIELSDLDTTPLHESLPHAIAPVFIQRLLRIETRSIKLLRTLAKPRPSHTVMPSSTFRHLDVRSREITPQSRRELQDRHHQDPDITSNRHIALNEDKLHLYRS
ncbi:hypothetical protein MRB53_042055 [Persea americana]|nr:hypothetical protein MRB53_042055 [Persea americana]